MTKYLQTSTIEELFKMKDIWDIWTDGYRELIDAEIKNRFYELQ